MPRTLLRRYPLLSLLPPDQLDGWLSSGLEVGVASGETIFQEGLPGDWAYLVLDGRVRVLRRSEQGKEVSLGLLEKGELFGDYALVRPYTNTATCRSGSPSKLLGLPLQPLRRLLAGLANVTPNLKNWLRLHALLAYLRGRPFLGFMTAPSALLFLDHLRPATFEAGFTIQADGLSDDCWYFIESGAVSLQLPQQQGSESGRQLGPGDCFGERALAGHGDRQVAVALFQTHCQFLPRDHFLRRPTANVTVSNQSLKPEPPTLARQYVWIGQQDAADCGVACLAMLARFLGLDVSLTSLRQSIPVSQIGASLQALQRLASSIGLQALPVRVSAEQLPQVALPAVAHYRNGHYVALYEFGVKGVVIGDPAIGVLRATPDEFKQAWSGNLLLVGNSCTPACCRLQ